MYLKKRKEFITDTNIILKILKTLTFQQSENGLQIHNGVFNLYLDEKFPISRNELTKKLKEKNIDTRDAFVR